MAVRYGLKVVDVEAANFVEIQLVNTDEVKRRIMSMFTPKKSNTTFVLPYQHVQCVATCVATCDRSKGARLT